MSVLKSGDEYTLSQLFSGDRKIIIPDLQRDYCWGDEKHGAESTKVELVSGFVKGLMQSFEDNKDERLMLGLIYGFENPINHVHLCDGQQRITTLFLILGMLCRKNGCDSEANHLISKFEYIDDDKEPYLQYSIRESTLYFLSDLVCHFFIKKDECESVKAIEKTNWYFNSYNQDPSIQSMLKALTIIEKSVESEYDWTGFQKYVENKIFMLYFDLENRVNGEDLFVIINTTGEPLTATENLKPVLLGSLGDDTDLNKQWEDREDFFWKHKKENEHEADNGHLDFITWYIKIKKRTNDVKILDYFKVFSEKGVHELTEELNTLHCFFEKYKELISLIERDSVFANLLVSIRAKDKVDKNTVVYTRNFTYNDDKNRNHQLKILLPLLYFTAKISSDKNDIYQFLRRLRKNYFDKEFDKRDGKYLDWRYILQIISMKNSLEDILTYQPIDNQPLNSISNVEDYSADWYNSEEQIKDELKKDKSYKQSIEDWEDHPDFRGDVSSLFKIHLINSSMSEIPSLTENRGGFSNLEFSELERYYLNYSNLEQLMIENNGKQNPNLANYYRLFKVFTNCNRIGHVSYTTDIESVWFSGRNRNQFRRIACLKLYKSDDHITFIQSFIRDIILKKDLFNVSEDNFNVKKLIKAWLSLKVFKAEQNNMLLSYFDGNGIGAHRKFDKNVIKGLTPSNIQNYICGYAVKSGGGKGNRIHTACKNDWSDNSLLDNSIAGISKKIVDNREAIDPATAQKAIDLNKDEIETRIETFVKSQKLCPQLTN